MFDADVTRSTDAIDAPSATKTASPKSAGKPPRAPKPKRPRTHRWRELLTEAPWASYIDVADRYGFSKLKNQQLRTMEERQYEDIIIDEAKWAKLNERMSADFDHELEMFPFAEREEELFVNHANWVELASARIGNFLKNAAQSLKLTGDIRLPRRYYVIARHDIEERFPGGRASGEPGDGDIRDMLSAFRHLFRENLSMYIGKKRRYQLTAVALYGFIVALLLLARGYVTVFLDYVAQSLINLIPGLKLDPDLGIVTPFLIGGLFIWLYGVGRSLFVRESEILFNVYNNAQTESCKTLDKQAALRTKNLANLLTTMAARIDKDQSQLMSSGKAQDWPERAFRWTLVVYWQGRRLENLERFTQMQIWLVRRTHYYYRLVASTSKHLVNGACLAWLLFLSACVALFGFNWGTGIETAKADLFHSFHDRLNALIAWARHLGATRIEAGLVMESLAHAGAGKAAAGDVWQTLFAKALSYGSEGFFIIACGLGLVLSIRFLSVISDLSGNEWNTSLQLVEQNLDVKNWDRYHSVHLHRVLADQVRSDKGYLLQWETRMGGKFPGR